MTAIVVAHAKRAVASVGERPAAAKSLKKRGKTAVITVVWNAEFAQSYIAQARSSGRFKPDPGQEARGRGEPRSEGSPRDPLAKQ